MNIALKGSSPAALTAGIFLLTRARQLGMRIAVSIVGDEDDIITVPGPAVCYAPVLASCGVGRTHGQGATVVIAGPPGKPVLATVTPHGEGGWFYVDRAGDGAHPATQAMASLARDEQASARAISKELRRAMDALGMATDPAVLDVLFGADVPVLTRLAVALRAGRSISGGRGEPVTRFLINGAPSRDPLPPVYGIEEARQVAQPDQLGWILDGLSTSIYDRASQWVEQALALDDDRARLLVAYLAEVASHLVQLPDHSILPPLGAAEDSVAVGLKSALRAEGDEDANRQLHETFRFLGGKFVDHDDHPHQLTCHPPPKDPVARWGWFCREVRKGRKQADAIWPNLVDPPQ